MSIALRLACAVAWIALLLPSPANAQEQVDEPAIRGSILSSIELDTGRGIERLPRVTRDPIQQDVTVVFAMRRPLSDDPARIVAAATDDIFNILWAVYTTPTLPPVRTATVLGTYAVVGHYSRPKEIPLIRAVLTADSAARLDWGRAATLDPATAFDVWWVPGELVGFSSPG